MNVVRVYLSSSLDDLREERAVAKQVLAADAIVRDSYGATENDLRENWREDLSNCDVYVGILGFRYGFVPPGEVKSITHLEYDEARNRGIPTLMFIKDDAVPVSIKNIDAHNPESLQRITDFRQFVFNTTRPALFRTLQDLTIGLLMAFTDWRARRSPDPVDLLGPSFPGSRALAHASRPAGADNLPSSEPPTTKLFLCYRRDDTQDAARYLAERLGHAYGPERVFVDIDSVPLGVDFVDHVTAQISRCNVVIVMIGTRWLTIKDKRRRRRLDDPEDLVRAEVRAALQQKIRVIPVTVQNASMPHGDDLPDDIRPLARRNGIELSHTRWNTDVERLLKELDKVMKA